MRYILGIMIAVHILSTSCCAVDIRQSISEEIGLDGLVDAVPSELKDMLSQFDLLTGEGADAVFQYLKDAVIDSVKDQLATIWKPAVQTLLITIICSMMHAIVPGDKQTFPLVLAGSAAIVFLTLSDTRSFFQYCAQTIQRTYEFSTVLLPCLAGVSVFTGATLSSGAKYTAAALFMNILLNFCNNFFVPLIAVYLTCVIGNTVFEQRILGAVSGFIKWLCTTVLTGSVVIFTTYLSVAGLISSAGDALTTRAAKTAIANGLPIVGNIISDTASTLVAGAAVLRNSVGVFGMLVVLGILVVPFISMGVRYLLFKGVGELAELFPNHKFSRLIQGIAGAYGMMMAVVGTGFVMLFLTVISFMNLMTGG